MEQEVLFKKISALEKELGEVKALLHAKKKPHAVKLRGIAKSNLSDEELEAAIEEAKKSLFSAAKSGGS